ncbi:signaling peptide protein [Bacillus safensis FO-36b] [Bacillus safensis subsp. safensis]
MQSGKAKFISPKNITSHACCAGFYQTAEKAFLKKGEKMPDGWAEPIHLFFQIDTSRLESHVEKQLEQGIPFRTKDEFEHVLEVMKPYRNEVSF